MAGHSKWANIKHKKGAEDAKRSKIFQKLSKEIMISIKEGGGTNPDTNSKLRLAIEKSKAANVPSDNIKKLLSKSNKDNSSWKEITYEGYGPGGVAVLVKCLTDNINRTSASVKSNFTKGGGNLGTNGSVSYLFESKGILVLDSTLYSNDHVMEIVLEADILDMREDGEVIIIETSPNKLISTKELLESQEINKFLSSEVSMIASNTIEVDEKTAIKLEKLIDELEDNDDVQEVYTNVS